VEDEIQFGILLTPYNIGRGK